MIFLLLLLFFPLEANIKFSATHARYHGDKLLLEGEVSLENDVGIWRATRAHLIRDLEKASGALFSTLFIEGESRLSLKRGGEMICFDVEGDLISKRFHFFGNPEIQFCDGNLEIMSKEAELFYEEREHSVVVKSLILKNGIRMKREMSQVALADRVEYFPEKDEAHFISENSPVLFLDEKKKFTIAAKKVIARDRGNEIQGVGDVRFTLQECELKKLDELMSWKKNS